MIERSHLAILREVHRLGSLTAAAEALYLSQSALSHSMKKLEQQIGTPVWSKSGRSLHFTQAGFYLLRLAERVLPQFEHAEVQMQQFASGQRGTLRIGMECHPCYQWLLKVVHPYLQGWPDVDVDVKQKFQFGGLGALFGYEIDVLVTPDPLLRPGIRYIPVFDYEQVLVVSAQSPLANEEYIAPDMLLDQTLITYPVEQSRLDVYSQFLTPAKCSPRKHKLIETTDIMLQMVAAGRGVAALPKWLAKEYEEKMPIVAVRLGESGIHKHIHLGVRETDLDIDYLSAFISLADSLSEYKEPSAL
ncbi:LysR substrate-binding domain-containing protein [Photobacterium sp. WH77]|uniref:LysR family transcriptional regulator n=1 Tax=unclassified Photobacterium TaxID=2628852 RepID=UPI001C47BB9D|nr:MULTISPECIES: LysR family transcriptional regulator [unclassified Photobacterium]MBV7261076.1 LysR family transcriptional regulator [Photobacterium sp. WH24]MCG2835490.1 LysR substrate-binding domain-containing protein [Photobacterium sp. WH77]MCG2843103.1 LysR substrate-binding domain-containing protein [Photobacterium sp. WH80]